jgi:hypothetical protein
MLDVKLIPPPEKWRPLLEQGVPDGEDVASWQCVLLAGKYNIGPSGADGNFGPRTKKATIQWQADRGLTSDGRVGGESRANIGRPPIVRDGEPRFIQAKNYTWANRGSLDVALVVIHVMEISELLGSAEACASWFAGLTSEPPKVSAHECIDGDSVVRCVRPEHVAWAAEGANRIGLQFEIAGRSRQTLEEWNDPYSAAAIKLAGQRCAVASKRFTRIKPRFLDEEEFARVYLDPKRDGGITTHAVVNRAFVAWKRLGLPQPKDVKRLTHWDPGPNFPMDKLLQHMREAAGAV